MSVHQTTIANIVLVVIVVCIVPFQLIVVSWPVVLHISCEVGHSSREYPEFHR
jgi:hypothetical protein